MSQAHPNSLPVGTTPSPGTGSKGASRKLPGSWGHHARARSVYAGPTQVLERKVWSDTQDRLGGHRLYKGDSCHPSKVLEAAWLSRPQLPMCIPAWQMPFQCEPPPPHQVSSPQGQVGLSPEVKCSHLSLGFPSPETQHQGSSTSQKPWRRPRAAAADSPGAVGRLPQGGAGGRPESAE